MAGNWGYSRESKVQGGGEGISLSGEKYDVGIVGAGPAGLILAVILARLGIKTAVLDERPEKTAVGRADGIQPKTIETLQMLGLGDELLRMGVKVYDICIWRGSADSPIHRIGREIHYPADVVDVLHPHILLCHQGMVESVLIDDLRSSGVTVHRGHRFKNFEYTPEGSLDLAVSMTDSGSDVKDIHAHADYVVGCDGARSVVRQQIPGTHATATPHESYWGVLDGELDTDFPDIWSKTVVFSEEHGSVLIIPRERNMTRIYIEMKAPSSAKSKDLGQDFVMEQAKRILAPYRVEWLSVEWFGNYQVAQRVAARFADSSLRAFIAGDASHTHSPKAAQGMNTSMHDAWNLGWKLNLAVRGLTHPTPSTSSQSQSLLESYETERMKIAHDLIDFDLEHANEIARGDAKRLAENFRTNTRFISGAGVEYGENFLNYTHNHSLNDEDEDGDGSSDEVKNAGGDARPGCTLPPAKATRYIDANPIDLQLDIPILGQFRIYVVTPDITLSSSKRFLTDLSESVTSPSSSLSALSDAAAKSYATKPRPPREGDVYTVPARYLGFSELFTFCLITSTPKALFEISSLPSLFASTPWTIYLDNVSHMDTRGQGCIRKWVGELRNSEVAVLNVRPDGYLGSIGRWEVSETTPDAGEKVARWLDKYYGGFLMVPPKS